MIDLIVDGVHISDAASVISLSQRPKLEELMVSGGKRAALSHYFLCNF